MFKGKKKKWSLFGAWISIEIFQGSTSSVKLPEIQFCNFVSSLLHIIHSNSLLQQFFLLMWKEVVKDYLIISELFFLVSLTFINSQLTSSKNLKKNMLPVYSELIFEHVSFSSFTTKAIVSFLRNSLK